MPSQTLETICGSSPRGRGKREGRNMRYARDRLIPARAGKTSPPSAAPYCHAAHPRAGGENALNATMAANPIGSSPRGRGKLVSESRRSAVSGLIPARAGKTDCRSLRCVAGPAHPRAGGENLRASACARWFRGSSPRGRGKRQTSRTDRPPTRLIPARAGKTHDIPPCSCRWGAHPRAGGENLRLYGLGALHEGSSPRGRGKRASHPHCTRRPGLIPARAGKTKWTVYRMVSHAAHPRAGGENTF